MIVNTFNHRDASRIPEADRFNPAGWVEGSADASWLFNFFSHGPQACPGADLALQLGAVILAVLLATGRRRRPVPNSIRISHCL